MTSNLRRQELEKIKDETETKIKDLKLELKHLESMLSDIKGQIFRLINSETPMIHTASPIKPINERKLK